MHTYSQSSRSLREYMLVLYCRNSWSSLCKLHMTLALQAPLSKDIVAYSWRHTAPDGALLSTGTLWAERSGLGRCCFHCHYQKSPSHVLDSTSGWHGRYEETAVQGNDPRRFTLSDFRYCGYGPDQHGEQWKHQEMEFQHSRKSNKFTNRSCRCSGHFVNRGHYGIAVSLLLDTPQPPPLEEEFSSTLQTILEPHGGFPPPPGPPPQLGPPPPGPPPQFSSILDTAIQHMETILEEPVDQESWTVVEPPSTTSLATTMAPIHHHHLGAAIHHHLGGPSTTSSWPPSTMAPAPSPLGAPPPPPNGAPPPPYPPLPPPSSTVPAPPSSWLLVMQEAEDWGPHARMEFIP